ncbi:GNAT family N-acetyltransferase [Vibrio penaeicida]|uniref:N-acetyltransferase n=1 Tax=Vibrio penaeicida TaxID=104609 RepID=A0AAV5NUB7_9VIBR|nr:GNAT family protein [Vibrio penaeicida]RTZ24058.1 N-acetyltransferase [Vibrio penaeicida]GLQ74185.1 N-acetyltransferase [Vibrio penaeicida]
MVETEHLILVPTSHSDLDIYKELLSSAIVTRYLPSGKPYTDNQIQTNIKNREAHWLKHGFGTFTVCQKSDRSKKLGYVGVEESPEPNVFEVRYAIVPEAQGHGVAQEAARACLDFTFQTSKLSKIYGVAVNENYPSIKVIEKLGMQPEPDAHFYDFNELLYYSISRH